MKNFQQWPKNKNYLHQCNGLFVQKKKKDFVNSCFCGVFDKMCDIEAGFTEMPDMKRTDMDFFAQVVKDLTGGQNYCLFQFLSLLNVLLRFKI